MKKTNVIYSKNKYFIKLLLENISYFKNKI
jgi:hypothetical protein